MHRPEATTLLDLLDRGGVAADGGVRFVDRDESATWFGWGEIRAQAEAVAAGLSTLGITRGERVGLVFPTCVEFFAAFFGTLLVGAVPVPLYPPVRLGRLDEYLLRTARMLESASARLVLADGRVRRILGEAIAAARTPLGCKTLDALPHGSRPSREALDLTGADLALVQFSSGTTVEPKPVALSHRAVLAQVEALNTFWQDTRETKHSCVSWLPLYHDMGLIGCVFPALARDASLTLLGPETFIGRPALWLRCLGRYRGTISTAPNFGYALCLSRIRDEDMEGVDLSSWQAALNGAESIAPQVLRAFAERFARWGFEPRALTPVYGLSEASLAVTFSSLQEPFVARRFSREALAQENSAVLDDDGRELVSVGRPLPNFAIRIVDSEGQDLPEERIGRVWISGPSLMEGYLDRPEATARALRDGWLDSGDLGFLHAGELFLTGRAKDVVILRGRNYAPEEIERAVDSVAGVRTGCAVAVSWLPEGSAGEVLTLLVEIARDATPEQVADLPAACSTAVLAATGLSTDRVLPLAAGTLPRTSSGKLRRAESLRLYLVGELSPPESVNPLRLAGALAKSSLAFARHGIERRLGMVGTPNPKKERARG